MKSTAMPYPPEDVQIQAPTSDSINVTWCQPPEWPPSQARILEFKVEYKPEGLDQWLDGGVCILHLCIYLFVCLFVCLFIYLFLFVCLFLFVLFVFIYLFICVFVYLFCYLFFLFKEHFRQFSCYSAVKMPIFQEKGCVLFKVELKRDIFQVVHIIYQNTKNRVGFVTQIIHWFVCLFFCGLRHLFLGGYM